MTEDFEKFNGQEKDNLKVEKIDPVALNKNLFKLKQTDGKKYLDILNGMSAETISDVAKAISKCEEEDVFIYLNNFNNKPEIIAQPEIIEKFKSMLSSGKVHFFGLERIIKLSSNQDIFKDQDVQTGVKNIIAGFISPKNSSEWNYIVDSVDNVIAGAKIDEDGLKDIAKKIRERNEENFNLFVNHFRIIV